MSLARSCLTFVIDISPTMGEERTIAEDVELQSLAARPPDSLPDELRNEYEASEAVRNESVRRTRTVTNLEWAMEFVAGKVQAYVLAGLKTAKVCIITFGSPRTHNAVLDTTEVTEGYQGVDEIFQPDCPSVSTLEMLRCLRAAREEDNPHPADPLDALIAAILTNNDKERGGINIANGTSQNTWNRTIYLITDGRSQMSTDSSNDIRDKLREGNFKLKVVGIDFDDPDYGFVEPKKDPIKAENEEWWASFLAELPGSGLATAADAIEQARMPTLQLKKSAPAKTTLSFGNPDARYGAEASQILFVPIMVAKATALERPMSQKKMSKVAQASAAARQETQGRSGAADKAATTMKPSATPAYSQVINVDEEIAAQLTYAVEMIRQYYVKDDFDRIEGGIKNAKPLPEGAEEEFARAYKLGASLIPIDNVDKTPYESIKGMEIVHFISAAKYRREYHMGETSFVFADLLNPKAQLQISALVRAMFDLDKLALVRYVRTEKSEPRLGVLSPVLKNEARGHDFECFYFVEVPFREDLKRYHFPPLHHVVNRDGKELHEHRTLPTTEMQGVMDELVESMNLMDAYVDEDGSRFPWFSTEDSFNPAIHRIKEAVAWRVFHPDDGEVPRPHPEVDKFLDRPEVVAERSKEVAERARELFQLTYAPTEMQRKAEEAKERKREREAQQAGKGGDDRTLTLDDGKALGEEETPDGIVKSEGGGKLKKVKRAAADDDESATEDEDDDEDEVGSSSKIKEDPSEVPANGEVRISPSNPVYDFRRFLNQRFNEIAAFEGMFEAIRVLVLRSMGSNTYARAAEAMRVCRAEALENDEVERWNNFVRRFKEQVTDDTAARSRRDFWNAHCRGRLDVGLITADEDPTKESEVTKEEAKSFAFH